MSSTDGQRPRPLHVSKSFTRIDTQQPDDAASRKRSSTLQSPGITAVPAARALDHSARQSQTGTNADVFETQEENESRDDLDHATEQDGRLPGTLEDLPVEIRSLTERFLDGLSAKVHPAPLSADQLSQIFQEFYERASAQISTHIASLSAKIGREKDASAGRALKGRSRASSGAKRSDSPASTSGGEMLTAAEVADRRKARRLLELKRLALEETVEECVCERLYDKLWKHKSTDDEARDEKLRSKIAALTLVGIGLKELHTDIDLSADGTRSSAAEKEQQISASLAIARQALQKMDDERSPLGKLLLLTTAHKSIVETLSEHFPSSSSADDILPTLIFTLIISPPESICVVSNLCFIQRFRNVSKVDGEAAYCLVNLEAAIAFLETVDLSSLRADELPQGPPKSSSRPDTPNSSEQPLVTRSPKPEESPISTKLGEVQLSRETATATLSSPSSTVATRPGLGDRSLSSMMQAQVTRFESGRENILSTADKMYDSINGTLESSMKFVFGRFKEQTGTHSSPLPKTLDDARRLINPPTSLTEDEEALTLSGRSSPLHEEASRTSSDPKMLELLAGRKQLRDHSTDSTRSGGSGKRVAFMNESTPTSASTRLPSDSLTGAANFITSINPLNRFGVPSFPRFGRVASSPTAKTPQATDTDQQVSTSTKLPANAERTQTHGNDVRGEQLNAREALAALKRIKPPKKRFIEAGSASDLRIGEVDELLAEYKRLAKAIGQAIAGSDV